MSGLIPEGKFRAKAVDWGFGEAGTGTFQIGVLMEITNGPEGQPPDQINWYGFLTEKALPVTVKALGALGWKGIDLTELENRGGGLDTNEVEIVVEHEEYDGKLRAKVKWINSGGGLGMSKRVEGDSLKAFAAKMRASIVAADPSRAKTASNGKKPPTRGAAPPAEPQGDGDEIPF